MLDKLAEVEKRYEELERLMSDPQLLNQQREYSKLAKERAELEEIVTRFREFRMTRGQPHFDPRDFADQAVAHDLGAVVEIFLGALPRADLPNATVLSNRFHDRLLLGDGRLRRWRRDRIGKSRDRRRRSGPFWR